LPYIHFPDIDVDTLLARAEQHGISERANVVGNEDEFDLTSFNLGGDNLVANLAASGHPLDLFEKRDMRLQCPPVADHASTPMATEPTLTCQHRK